MSAAVWWLLAGGLMVALEALAMPGVGVLFAGLAAITVGAVIEAGVVAETSLAMQLAWFCGLTGVWAAVLWKPLKRFYNRPGRKPYNNIIGSTAKVINHPLRKGEEGEVQWSGTVMGAKIDDTCAAESILVGADVSITHVHGNILTVVPKT